MRNPTGYYRPQTIAEAVKLLSQPHITTALLSGGTLRLAEKLDPDFEAVIDLQDIAGLGELKVAGDKSLRIGANVTLDTLRQSDTVPLLLRNVLKRTVPWNRRNGITIGESIEFPGEVPEFIAALLALDATVVFSMPEDQRIPLGDISSYIQQPKLPQKGLITAVEIPAPQPGQAWGESHVARTPADKAIVSAVAVLVLDEQATVTQARLALTGVWPEPAGLAPAAAAVLVGAPLSKDQLNAALAALEDEIAPVADYRGSIAYRRAMARVAVCRALEQC